MPNNSRLKLILLTCVSALLTALTVILGAIPMRVIYRNWGRQVFWAAFLTLAAGFALTGQAAIAAAILLLAVIVGSYTEAERSGSSVFGAGAIATLVAVGVAAGGAAVWAHLGKVNLVAAAKDASKAVVDQVLLVNPHVEINSDLLAYQVPSFLVVAIILALAAALIWEKRMEAWFTLPLKPVESGRLLSFRVPDAFVWLVILAAIGAFVEHGRPVFETISLNILNVVVAIYFFQGLAVMGQVFRFYKVTPFWQTFWFLVAFIQLFPLAALIGFTDLWFDYRNRLVRKAAEVKKSF